MPDYKNFTIEQIYQELANLINNSIKEPWFLVNLYAFIDNPDTGITWGLYKTQDAEEFKHFDTGFEYYLLFEEIRVRTKKDGDDSWPKYKMILTSDGKFDLQIKYIPNNQKAIEAENEFIQKNLDQL